ncbi:hypothetical protein BVRB_2g038290 [Beta vulgaris subsp. vulgaris]|nr:hypothetical protein BVRB_2g038290 [Beta vulgaris subsp. vulgaris]
MKRPAIKEKQGDTKWRKGRKRATTTYFSSSNPK